MALNNNASFDEILNAINSLPVNPISNAPTGNAQPQDVLSGKTFSNIDGKDKIGTMPNHNAITITPKANNQNIPAGYHNGSGIVKGDPELKPENIKTGVNIFGVNGIFSDSSNIKIKSIQHYNTYDTRGPNWEETYNKKIIKIKKVDVNKSIIVLNNASEISLPDYINMVPEFVDNTTIRLSCYENNSGENIYASISVIEFESGVQVQRGTYPVTKKSYYGFADIDISPVDINKSIPLVYIKGKRPYSSSNVYYCRLAYHFQNNNKLIVNSSVQLEESTLVWQILTFS